MVNLILKLNIDIYLLYLAVKKLDKKHNNFQT